MAYTRTNWVDGTTPVNASDLNNIETELVLLDGLPRIPAVVNGQWLKGVGGVPVWSAIAAGDIPDISGTYQSKAEKALANGYPSLDSGGKIPVGQVPDLSGTYQVRTEKGAASGYASLDATGKVPAAQLPASGGGSVFPIQLRNPQMAANQGNSFPTVSALTAWEEWHWEFVQKQLGKIFGTVRIPEGSTIAAQKIVLEIGANGTGNTRLSVKTYAVVAGASYNPASLFAITAQVVNIPTARTRQTVTFTQGGETWHA